MGNQLSEFGVALLFFIAGIVFVMGGLFTSFLVRPNRPNSQKLTAYECGEEPLGTVWGRFNIRFYVVALIFLLFDVEIVFLFPWATVFADATFINSTNGLWGWFSLVEAMLFLFILGLGLAYAWRKGYLEWIRPKPDREGVTSKIPEELYQAINKKYS